MGLVLLLGIVLPLSMSAWISTLLLSSVNNECYDLISPGRCLASVLMPITITCWGLKKRSLDISGAITGLFIGFILTLSNYCFFAALLCFFITASRATKFRSHQKFKFEDDFKEGGQRNWVQVLCNGGVATELSLVYMIEHGCGESAIDFTGDYHASWLAMGTLGAIACANGDTWASELGSVIGKGLPFLITTWQRVPQGTNGGISVTGVGFSALGGAAIGMAYYCSLLLFIPSGLLSDSPPQWPVIIVAAMAGLLGSLLDSVLGATLQYSGIDCCTGKIVEHTGENIRHINGSGILDNNSVNLLSTGIMALLTPGIAMTVWSFVRT